MYFLSVNSSITTIPFGPIYYPNTKLYISVKTVSTPVLKAKSVTCTPRRIRSFVLSVTIAPGTQHGTHGCSPSLLAALVAVQIPQNVTQRPETTSNFNQAFPLRCIPGIICEVWVDLGIFARNVRGSRTDSHVPRSSKQLQTPLLQGLTPGLTLMKLLVTGCPVITTTLVVVPGCDVMTSAWGGVATFDSCTIPGLAGCN